VVIDLADVRRSRFALLGGQSGNPASPMYGDQLDAFESGGMKTAWTDEEIVRMKTHELRLDPA
jgi:acyl-homoserine lactone acylase PvdQ